MSTAGLDYLPRTNLAEVSNNDESIMNIQRIREFVRTLSIMDICWLIPDRLDVFAFKTVGKCWSAKFRASVLNSFPDKIEPFKRLLTFPMLWSNTTKSIRDIYIYIFDDLFRIDIELSKINYGKTWKNNTYHKIEEKNRSTGSKIKKKNKKRSKGKP